MTDIKGFLRAHIPAGQWLQLRHMRQRLNLALDESLAPLKRRIVLRNLELSRPKQIEDYFARFPVRKLQLGAGSNILAGWLNSEGFAPSSFTTSASSDYILLDVRESFPFDDGVFDYIFHEHVIEHMAFHQAEFMLKECFRILKPGGRMRISTPDLAFFVNLYGADRNTEQAAFLSEYVRFNSGVWSNDLGQVRDNHAVFVLNHAVRAWGHEFIYDQPTLLRALQDAGFSETARQLPQQSAHEALRGLEYRRDSVGVLDALVIEATKPAQGVG